MQNNNKKSIFKRLLWLYLLLEDVLLHYNVFQSEHQENQGSGLATTRQNYPVT